MGKSYHPVLRTTCALTSAATATAGIASGAIAEKAGKYNGLERFLGRVLHTFLPDSWSFVPDSTQLAALDKGREISHIYENAQASVGELSDRLHQSADAAAHASSEPGLIGLAEKTAQVAQQYATDGAGAIAEHVAQLPSDDFRLLVAAGLGYAAAEIGWQAYTLGTKAWNATSRYVTAAAITAAGLVGATALAKEDAELASKYLEFATIGAGTGMALSTIITAPFRHLLRRVRRK